MFSVSSGFCATARLYVPKSKPVPKAAKEIGNIENPTTMYFTAVNNSTAEIPPVKDIIIYIYIKHTVNLLYVLYEIKKQKSFYPINL